METAEKVTVRISRLIKDKIMTFDVDANVAHLARPSTVPAAKRTEERNVAKECN